MNVCFGSKEGVFKCPIFIMKSIFRLVFIVLGVVFFIKHIYLVGVIMVLIGIMMPFNI
jgi:hypothetical protein